MAADEFFARWSKRKAEAASLPAASDPAADLVAANAAASDPQTIAKPLPTLADVEGLTAESDYAAFLVKGVDEAVKRGAMKKLFALPQFNIMDGLDIYVGDYSQPDPLPPGMLEALNHARSALNPVQFLAEPVPQLLEPVAEQAEPASAAASPSETIVQNAATNPPENPASSLQQEDIRSAPALAVETHRNEAV
ncbi:MAG: DUF3306 domain-containing protein [Telluria sp.]|nr:DUF3306 domain-containing protein [Telluria sp.]